MLDHRPGRPSARPRRPAVEGLEARPLLAGFAAHAGPPVQASPGAVAYFRATFDDPGPGPYRAEIDWGDGTTSAGAIGAIDYIPGVTGDPNFVSARHAYAAFGTYTITLTIADPGGRTAEVTDTATVAGLVATPSAVRGVAGAGLAATTPLAYVAAADPAARASDLAATIDWGDGTTSAGTLAPAVRYDRSPVPPGTPAAFVVEGGHAYRSAGTYAITLTISDAAGHGASALAAAIIGKEALATAGLPITAAAGVATGPVAVAEVSDSIPATTDDPAASLRATIDWGDGTTSAGTFAPGSGVAPGVRTPGRLYGPFIVLGAHDYGRAGSYMIHVAVASVAGAAATTASSANVAAPAPGPAILPAQGAKAPGVAPAPSPPHHPRHPGHHAATGTSPRRHGRPRRHP